MRSFPCVTSVCISNSCSLDSFKLIIDFLVNRINSINGRRYGDDPTILAWETGNEVNHLGMRPAPASWTLIVARHLKSRAPKTLVMDGSFARNDDPERCYQKEVLESEDVDIVSYHYYGNGEIRRVKKDCEIAKRHNKVYVRTAGQSLALLTLLAFSASSPASSASSRRPTTTLPS